MNTNHYKEDRLIELLTDQATEGLDVTHAKELDDLLAHDPLDDAQAFELAAAAFDLAMMPPEAKPIPDTLRGRILSDAVQFFEDVNDQSDAQEDNIDPVSVEIDPASRTGWRGRVGWFVAAASLLLAVMGWWPALTQNDASVVDMAQQYAIFMNDATDMISAEWQGKEPGFENVSGNVVWSDSQQSGFMKLMGLPQNDPQEKQYQLWIVDPNRDKNPVDGGVFDVHTSGEIVIPINAKLPVDHPIVFAITLEQPGGVVVSAGPLLIIGAAS